MTSVQLDALALMSPAYSAGTAAGAAHASDTSVAAAEHVNATIGARQAEVLETLRTIGPATGEEVARKLSRQTYTVLPRLTELHTRGLVKDTGDRRLNSTGRHATVWQVAA